MQSPVNLGLTTTEGFYSEKMINVRFYINFHLNWKYSYNTKPFRFDQKVIYQKIVKENALQLTVYFYSVHSFMIQIDN